MSHGDLLVPGDDGGDGDVDAQGEFRHGNGQLCRHFGERQHAATSRRPDSCQGEGRQGHRGAGANRDFVFVPSTISEFLAVPFCGDVKFSEFSLNPKP